MRNIFRDGVTREVYRYTNKPKQISVSFQLAESQRQQQAEITSENGINNYW